MSTDPSLIDSPMPPRVPRRQPDQAILPVDRPANDEFGMPEDIEERKAVFWVPVGIAFVLMLGIGYYFYGPHLAPLG
jgi:hypothetical protein